MGQQSHQACHQWRYGHLKLVHNMAQVKNKEKNLMELSSLFKLNQNSRLNGNSYVKTISLSVVKLSLKSYFLTVISIIDCYLSQLAWLVGVDRNWKLDCWTMKHSQYTVHQQILHIYTQSSFQIILGAAQDWIRNVLHAMNTQLFSSKA